MEDLHMGDDREPHPFGNGVAEAPETGARVVGSTNLPPLADGLDSFPEIRKRGCIYVDKTKYIAELLRSKGRVFCARPRRFGKSLMVSTIETLYSEDPEHRAMFEGLDIFPYLSKDDWIFRPRPVIRLTMSSVTLDKNLLIDEKADAYETLRIFRLKLLNYIQQISNKHGIPPIGVGADDTFRNLIAQLSQKKKEKVIILVDEYDFPLTTSIFRPDIQDEIRMIMRNFYLQVKNTGDDISFAFFTGIAKFSNVGVFSELNNLHDISIDKEYATMFGYTENEVMTYFVNRIENIAGVDEKAKNDLITHMKEYYDGYTFDGYTHVYNPYTIERFLMTGEFDKYWVETGRQQFVEKFFKKGEELKWEQLDGQSLSRDVIRSPRNVGVGSDPKIALYESGYMTIRRIQGTDIYKFVYPNIEVKVAMAAMVDNNYFHSIEEANKARADIAIALMGNDCEGIIIIFNTLFTNIFKSDKKAYEGSGSKDKEDLFRGHIKSFLSGANFIVQGEARTNVGIADIIAVYKGKTLVIEVKYVDLEPKSKHNDVVSRFSVETDCRDKLTQAISQIHGKNYDELFPNSLPIAIVIDESRAARISHAAYKKEAYRIDGKPPDFIKIGDVKYDGEKWSISYSSEITASKKKLPIAKSRADTISKKTANVKKTPTQKSGVSKDKLSDVQSLATHGNDHDSANMELFFCKAILPAKQYLSWSDSLKETDGDEIRNKIHRLAANLVETKSAEFWHALSQEEKNAALKEAIRSETSITLRYFTYDGNFCLTAIETTTDEAIGLLITQMGEAAYGPYPLSRLRENVSSLMMYDTAMKLGQICKDNGIKVDTPLPTPEQLLKWDEKK
jgi:hypothetical protein